MDLTLKCDQPPVVTVNYCDMLETVVFIYAYFDGMLVQTIVSVHIYDDI